MENNKGVGFKMDVLERLKSCKKIDKAIHCLQRKLKELDNSYYPKTIGFDQKVSTSKYNGAESRLINILNDKEDVINQIITLNEERLSVLDLIDNLSDYEEWIVITRLFFLCEPIEVICKELRLSKTQLYRVRKKAIERLEAEVKNS